MNRIRALGPLLTGCALALGAAPPALSQPAAQSDTLIRGENVRLRAEPNANADVVAILQRGDEILVTGDAELPDGSVEPVTAATLGIAYDVYVPVEVLESGDVGWVSEIFVDPRSFVPVAGGATAPAANAAPTATDETAGTATVAEDGGNAGRANRQNRRQNRDTAADTTPEATNGGGRDRRQNQQATTEETGAESTGQGAGQNRRQNRNAAANQPGNADAEANPGQIERQGRNRQNADADSTNQGDANGNAATEPTPAENG